MSARKTGRRTPAKSTGKGRPRDDGPPPGIPANLWQALHEGSPEDRLDAMAVLLTQVFVAIQAPPGEKPEGLAHMSRREACHRARVGRAARRAGMTLEAFVKRYGWVDQIPDDAATG